MHAQEKLYLTAGKDRLVREGDKSAAFLYAAIGDEIPQTAADRFGLVDGKLKARPARTQTLLHGSSVLPAVVEIAGGVSIQLGAIVSKAHKESGLDAEAWNALSGAERDERLQKTIDALKAEMAATPPGVATAVKALKAKPGAVKRAASSAKEKPAGGDKEQKAGANKGGAGAANDKAKD